MELKTSFLTQFEEQALKTPNNIAIDDGSHQLTYCQLQHQSTQLSKNLMGIENIAGGVVGVWMPRTVDLWVTILGLFKAGAIYLPLDPDWPKSRLSYIAEAAQVRSIICLEHTPQDIFQTCQIHTRRSQATPTA